jgi:hypothetical protein
LTSSKHIRPKRDPQKPARLTAVRPALPRSAMNFET